MKDVLNSDEVREVLEGAFYQRPAPDRAISNVSPPLPSKPARAGRAKKAKPDHYDVICISLYQDDLRRLDAQVRRLKASGHRKMNRSALIRFALDTMDVEKLPKSY